ncbi:hypothetical protein F5B21DRAFT_517424 [Xylaria acuta]|nr:hypothetical protein F5B21DRAFT_517424 [Xylaria acuta]
MRLINSHTWGHDREELTLGDVQEGRIDKPGARSVKFRGGCRRAKRDGLGYIWIDTCCIDKANTVELAEAINSMFRWYRRASVCYAYLSDVPSNDIPRDPASKFRASRWFQRGWTLQELLAPENLRFYDSEWCNIGNRGELCPVLEEITGVPRVFLLGITESHTASIAQRIAWAAQRETKRKEDLAYCLLGIFDVTMSMIYGEDDSILAWGLSIGNKDPRGESGQIVSRNQPTTSLNSFDISGGSLRIHLPLLTLPGSIVLGLLSCGPEQVPGQVVGISLTEVTSGRSDEYVRPNGYHSVLQRIPAPSTPAGLIHIKNDSPTTKSAGANQFWLYNDDRTMIISTITTPNTSHPTLVRLRHNEGTSKDFLMVLELAQQDIHIKAQCSVTVCPRSTPLEELLGKYGYVVKRASGKRSASNGLLNLRVALEPDSRQPMFTSIKPEILPRPPDVTVDATMELQRSDLMLELEHILEEEMRRIAAEEDLNIEAFQRTRKLTEIRTEREFLEGEQKRLKVKLEASIKSEEVCIKQLRHVTEKKKEAGEKGEQTFARGSSALRQIVAMPDTDGESTCPQPEWATGNHYRQLLELPKGNADATVANMVRSTLATPSGKQRIDIARLLLAAHVTKREPEDTERQAPLTYPVANHAQTFPQPVHRTKKTSAIADSIILCQHRYPMMTGTDLATPGLQSSTLSNAPQSHAQELHDALPFVGNPARLDSPSDVHQELNLNVWLADFSNIQDVFSFDDTIHSWPSITHNATLTSACRKKKIGTFPDFLTSETRSMYEARSSYQGHGNGLPCGASCVRVIPRSEQGCSHLGICGPSLESCI